MTAPLSLAATAREVGLSASHFRRTWESLVAERAFPEPFLKPPGAHFRWDADDVATWKRLRAGALGGDGRHQIANDVHPADRLPLNPTIPAPSPALATQRATLRTLMTRGA